MKIKLVLLLAVFILSVNALASSEDLRLTDLIKHYTEVSAAIDPFVAPTYGVFDYNSKLGHFPSRRYVRESNQLWYGIQEELETIDVQKLSYASSLDYQVFHQQLQNLIVASSHEGHWYMNLSHEKNRLVDFINQADPDQGLFPFKTFTNYLEFARRMELFPRYVKGLLRVEREGMAKGFQLSCYSVRKTSIYLKPALETNLDQNPFWKPVTQIPTKFSQDQAQKIKYIYGKMIQKNIAQAYSEAINFLDHEYSQNCQAQTGLSGTPDGDKLYQDLLRSEADTELDPSVIHEMGLKEVERIKGEFAKVQGDLGFKGTLKEFLDHMRNDPSNYFNTKEELIARFVSLKDLIIPLLPKFFDIVPTTPFSVVNVDEPGSAYARFPTTLNPSGAIVLQTGSLQTFPKFTNVTLFLHEGMPGHVLNGSIQFENANLSNYRRTQFYSSAFDEGWALYAEYLGYEMGLYDDPYARFGHLADDMLRAVRLVVDTGIHSMSWTRDQAVQYMDALVPYELNDTQNEIDRYLAIPAQAVSYKMGQFKILELRAYAEKELGSQFDLKKFNSAVVGDGIMPLKVLDQKMRDWILAQKTKN